GTPKAPSTGSGAAARMTSRSRHGCGSSARITPATSTACDVGSTAPRSNSRMRSTCSSTAESSTPIFSTSASLSCSLASLATCRTCARSRDTPPSLVLLADSAQVDGLDGVVGPWRPAVLLTQRHERPRGERGTGDQSGPSPGLRAAIACQQADEHQQRGDRRQRDQDHVERDG